MQHGCAVLPINCPLLAALSPPYDLRLAVFREILRNTYFSAHQLCKLGINWRSVGLICHKISSSLWFHFDRWGRRVVCNLFHLSTGVLSCICRLSLDLVHFENSLKSVKMKYGRSSSWGCPLSPGGTLMTLAWGAGPAALCCPYIILGLPARSRLQQGRAASAGDS